jgi:hypothetical protein
MHGVKPDPRAWKKVVIRGQIWSSCVERQVQYFVSTIGQFQSCWLTHSPSPAGSRTVPVLLAHAQFQSCWLTHSSSPAGLSTVPVVLAHTQFQSCWLTHSSSPAGSRTVPVVLAHAQFQSCWLTHSSSPAGSRTVPVLLAHTQFQSCWLTHSTSPAGSHTYSIRNFQLWDVLFAIGVKGSWRISWNCCPTLNQGINSEEWPQFLGILCT